MYEYMMVSFVQCVFATPYLSAVEAHYTYATTQLPSCNILLLLHAAIYYRATSIDEKFMRLARLSSCITRYNM